MSISQALESKLEALVKFLPALRENGVAAIKIDGIELALRFLPSQGETQQSPQGSQVRDAVTMGVAGTMKIPTLRDRHG